MVRLSACGARVFVEANGKAAGTEALVLAEGACMLHSQYVLYLLRSHARGRTNVTIMAEPCLFHLDRGNYPLGGLSTEAVPPAEFQEFPFVQPKRRRK